MQRPARYRDVRAEVKRFLAARVEAALAAGIARGRDRPRSRHRLRQDVAHNLALLAHVSTLAALGYPVVVGVSRKRFLGTSARRRPLRRGVDGTAAASLVAVAGGAGWCGCTTSAPMARASACRAGDLGGRHE